MDVWVMEKPALYLVGKQGEGDAAQGAEWVPGLWREATADYAQVAKLVKTENGRPAGVWGAMLAADRSFVPWGERGLYLAGYEVEADTKAPKGWKKWRLPACRYLVADCGAYGYGETLHLLRQVHLPMRGLALAGAVQEFYPADEKGQSMWLCCPVELLEEIAVG